MIINYRQAVPMVREVEFIEYIESDGNQYIDTGFKPNNNTRVIADIESNITTISGCFGGRDSQSKSSFVLWLMSTTIFRSDFNSSQNNIKVSSVLNRFVIDKNKNVCKIGTASTKSTSSVFQTSVNLFLMAINTNGEPEDRKFNGKLYSCQIYDNDNLIRDYVPALDENKTPCLYDKISEECIYNSGSGSFKIPS